jgi:TPR repeat protein
MSSADGVSELDNERAWTQVLDALRNHDEDEAMLYLRRIARKGDWTAMAFVGALYESGGKGVPQDFALAAKWYQRAIFDADDPYAHLGLGRMLYNGNLGARDYGAAKRHFEKAAMADLGEANLLLGAICQYGLDGSPPNAAKSRALYERASEQGFIYARAKLSRFDLLEGRRLRALRNIVGAYVSLVKIALKDRTDRRLIGFSIMKPYR